ncbi:threonine-phosphate decarboxylase CobD [Novosphingobium terrae]|uniref:threonine-phosphate decarboxylase CobD n=1 Tax=Novosphingobium terrae TaxID=2726189 RepID=UPI00197D410C|nr:threonine-phosphate decarboxylase CobD [Novosphingobium terrae]
MQRDHGGDLDRARAKRGGDDWIDLSTGINRVPYPVPALAPEAWTALPTANARDRLLQAAARAYRTQAPMVALAGAQAAIQMLPLVLGEAGRTVRILSPTYNEHAACFSTAGFTVEPVDDPAALVGASIAIVVNPNNPDGRLIPPADLLALRKQVGLLVVDESFADPLPDLSLAPHAGEPGLVVLRSFGKFFGLAGVRLGFALGDAAIIARLTAMAGPWPVAGPALEIGAAALGDAAWAQATTERLSQEVPRIDAMAQAYGWALAGGTHLFRLYETPDAAAAQEHLADHRIWSRIFPWSPRLIRLGLPGMECEWLRLAAALER